MAQMEMEQPILRRSESVHSALPLISETAPAPLIDYHLPLPDLAWDEGWDIPRTQHQQIHQQQQQQHQQQRLEQESIELREIGESRSAQTEITATPTATTPTADNVDNEGYISHPLEVNDIDDSAL